MKEKEKNIVESEKNLPRMFAKNISITRDLIESTVKQKVAMDVVSR